MNKGRVNSVWVETRLPRDAASPQHLEGHFESLIMSLFTRARLSCLKAVYVCVCFVVLSRRPLMPEFCLVTAVRNTAGENNRTPSVPSFTLPELPLPCRHTHTHTCSSEAAHKGGTHSSP